MRAAIKSAAVQNYQSHSNVTGRCPTNECSWEEFTTLAVCTSVKDVSPTIVVDHQDEDIPVFTVQALKDINRPPPEGEPGVRLTFWADTLHFPGLLDVSARNSSTTTKVPRNGIAALAETYILYYPACENKKPENEIVMPVRSNPKEWRALKGTMNICLQALQANYTDGRMNTTVLNETRNLNWTTKPPVKIKGDDLIQTCAEYNGEEYCFWGEYWSQYGRQIGEIFNGTAVLIEYGDDSYDPEDWMITLANDILGSSPSSCNGSKPLNLKGFEARFNNVAISITNA